MRIWGRRRGVRRGGHPHLRPNATNREVLQHHRSHACIGRGLLRLRVDRAHLQFATHDHNSIRVRARDHRGQLYYKRCRGTRNTIVFYFSLLRRQLLPQMSPPT